jgi:hypothetical protein
MSDTTATSPKPMDADREAFEAWAKRHGWDIRCCGSSYIDSGTNKLWIGWQAARDQDTQRIRELVEALNVAVGRMAHSGGKCCRLLPTEEWTVERGNRDAHCECEISVVRAALTKAEARLK